MISIIGTAVAFFLSLFVQVSFLSSLAPPLSYIPLHFLVGVIIFHRADFLYGLLWFTATAALMPFFHPIAGTSIAFAVTGVAGVILTKKVFTTRSLYALLGLGISLFTVFILSRWLYRLITSGFSESIFIGAVPGFIFVITGLYAGFFLVRYAQRIAKSMILVRR